VHRVQQHSPLDSLQAYNRSFANAIERWLAFKPNILDDVVPRGFLSTFCFHSAKWQADNSLSQRQICVCGFVKENISRTSECVSECVSSQFRTLQSLLKILAFISVCGSVKENISRTSECVSECISSHFQTLQSLLKILCFDVVYLPLVSLFRMWWNTLSSLICHEKVSFVIQRES